LESKFNVSELFKSGGKGDLIGTVGRLNDYIKNIDPWYCAVPEKKRTNPPEDRVNP
jgi:hypothetical protein